MVPSSRPPTFAQARVLLLLIAGESPQEAATSLGVAISTVRSHIRQLHNAAGTHSLPALIRWGSHDAGAVPLRAALAHHPRWSRAAAEVLDG
jgi:DNA-binding NarL/FixJ family response regulator